MQMKNKSLLLTIIVFILVLNSSAQVHTIGDKYGGGIVFYISDSGRHGLIAATADQSEGIQWYNGVYTYIGDTIREDVGAGAKKTAIIMASLSKDNPKGNFAARVCVDYLVTVDGITYNDWYLPSLFELNLLQLQKDVVGGFNDYYGGSYWSSTEGGFGNQTKAATRIISAQSTANDRQRNWDKMFKNRVRAIRAF